MPVTNSEYDRMAKQAAPPSRTAAHAAAAFGVGGAVCVLGQWLAEGYALLGLAPDDARFAATLSLVALAALATALGVYDTAAHVGGAGLLVPITGFANSIAAAAMEFKSEGWITGLGVKTFVIAGPVLVFGTAASALYGLILWILSLL